MIGCLKEASQHVINQRVRLQAKLMPPKRVCLQLEPFALITCCNVSLKYSIIFVQLYYKIN